MHMQERAKGKLVPFSLLCIKSPSPWCMNLGKLFLKSQDEVIYQNDDNAYFLAV